MKKCPFCKQRILDEAVKCRYCASDVSKEAEKQTVYILDQGLVRYVKVAGGFLALFIAAGVFLFGYNLNETAKEVGKTAKEADQTRKDAEKASHDADGARKDTEKAAQETVETLRKVKAAGEIAAAQRAEVER